MTEKLPIYIISSKTSKLQNRNLENIDNELSQKSLDKLEDISLSFRPYSQSQFDIANNQSSGFQASNNQGMSLISNQNHVAVDKEQKEEDIGSLYQQLSKVGQVKNAPNHKLYDIIRDINDESEKKHVWLFLDSVEAYPNSDYSKQDPQIQHNASLHYFSFTLKDGKFYIQLALKPKNLPQDMVFKNVLEYDYECSNYIPVESFLEIVGDLDSCERDEYYDELSIKFDDEAKRLQVLKDQKKQEMLATDSEEEKKQTVDKQVLESLNKLDKEFNEILGPAEDDSAEQKQQQHSFVDLNLSGAKQKKGVELDGKSIDGGGDSKKSSTEKQVFVSGKEQHSASSSILSNENNSVHVSDVIEDKNYMGQKVSEEIVLRESTGKQQSNIGNAQKQSEEFLSQIQNSSSKQENDYKEYNKEIGLHQQEDHAAIKNSNKNQNYNEKSIDSDSSDNQSSSCFTITLNLVMPAFFAIACYVTGSIFLKYSKYFDWKIIAGLFAVAIVLTFFTIFMLYFKFKKSDQNIQEQQTSQHDDEGYQADDGQNNDSKNQGKQLINKNSSGWQNYFDSQILKSRHQIQGQLIREQKPAEEFLDSVDIEKYVNK